MVASASTLRRPDAKAGVAAAIAVGVLVLGHGVLAARYPLLDLGLAVALAFMCFPILCRAVLVVAVAVGPTLNPPLVGLGASGGGGVAGGRVYMLQAVLVLVIVGAFAVAVRSGLHVPAAAIVALTLSLVVVQTVGRPHAGPAWIYRPMQVFLVCFATRALFAHRGHRRLLMALAWGGAVGCGLASVHALVPTFDPFSASRPGNLPFVSTIGAFARATGAFTYPNNLGTFAAYVVLFGAAALLLSRPGLPPPLAWLLIGTGSSALLLSGSRAAGIGLLCGLLYLTARLAPRRRALILLVEAVIGLVILLAVLSSPSAVEVAQQRIDTAAGSSLASRLDSSREAFDDFLSSPIIGTGATEARTDNFWLLYLSQGGLVGAVLFLLLGRTSLRSRPYKCYPELWVALLIAVGTSGLLQDSLGQTLTAWFPGVLLGLCSLPIAEGLPEHVPTP